MILLLLIVTPIAIWLYGVIYTARYFKHSAPTEEDLIFVHEDYTYEHCRKRLINLQKFVGRRLPKANRILDRYQINAKKTRRKFSYYENLIEPGMVRIYVTAKHFTGFSQKFKALSPPFRFQVVYCGAFFGLGFLLTSLLMLVISPIGFVFTFVLVAALFMLLYIRGLRFYATLLELFDSAMKKGNLGGFNRNVLLLKLLFTGLPIIGRSSTYYYTGIGYYAGGGIDSTPSDFGGFGGGSFGGGGAGGSW